MNRPRTPIGGRSPQRLARPAGAALLLALVLGAPLAGWSIHRHLQAARRTAEVHGALTALRSLVLDLRHVCQPALTGSGSEATSGTRSRTEVSLRIEHLRKSLPSDPQTRREVAGLETALHRALDQGSRALLLRLEMNLSAAAEETAPSGRGERRVEEAWKSLEEAADVALLRIDRLERRGEESLREGSAAARQLEGIALGLALLSALLLTLLLEFRRRREKHLQGARLVEDMLEAYTRRLESMNAELEQVNLLKTQILANTSHELLTPLNGVMGSLEVVRSGSCSSPTEEREFIDQAYESADHLLTLIRDLLDACRMETGSFALQNRGVDFSPILDRVLARHRTGIAQQGLALLVIPPPEGWPRVRADATRLDQVIHHLLSNSSKFTERGSIRITGRVETQEGASACLRIEVADTGVGIETEKLPHVFELFRQADGSNTRRYGGTGLGLTLCRHLIQGMGGNIGIESEGHGRGTRVVFSLPLADAAASQNLDAYGEAA